MNGICAAPAGDSCSRPRRAARRRRAPPAAVLLTSTAITRRPGRAGLTSVQTRGLPLLRDPPGATQGRLVGAGVADARTDLVGDLLHQRGLAHLPRPGHDLDEAAWLGQTPTQLGSLGALIAGFRITQHHE